MNEVTEIYDHLLIFESKKKKKEPYPIHKKLHFPDTKQDIHDWLISNISFSQEDNILDAGCGTGYELFRLHKLFGLTGTGISLSSAEISYANRACRINNTANYLNFKWIDYQKHQGGPYSKIIAIESLKHADNLSGSISHLLKMLTGKGSLIIIDDFVLWENEDTYEQKRLWNSHGLRPVVEYENIIHSSGDYKSKKIDLTPFVQTRPLWILNLLYPIFGILKNFTQSGLRRNMKTYLGGLLLEKLYKNKQVQYLALIIENKTV
jgi:SAM-dependent methyltransferase